MTTQSAASMRPPFTERIRGKDRPKEVAAGILFLVTYWPEMVDIGFDGIEAPPDDFTGADLRQSAVRRGSGLVAGIEGWASILTVPDDAELDESVPYGYDFAPCDTFLLNGGEADIYRVAMWALGLKSLDAEWLFGERTRDEIIAAVTNIIDGRPVRGDA